MSIHLTTLEADNAIDPANIFTYSERATLVHYRSSTATAAPRMLTNNLPASTQAHHSHRLFRLAPDGRKNYVLQTHICSKPCWFTIGLRSRITLDEARAAALDILAQTKIGIDPRETDAKRKAELPGRTQVQATARGAGI